MYNEWMRDEEHLSGASKAEIAKIKKKRLRKKKPRLRR
jgi:hypothetical protein